MGMETPLAKTQKATHALIVLGLLFLYLPFLYFYGFRYVGTVHVDFPSFYWGAKAAFVDGLSPYGPLAFGAGQAELDQIVWPYLYPPPSLLFFYPFTFVDYEIAKKLMLLLNHFVVLGMAYLLLFKLDILKVNTKTALGVALLLFFGTYLLLFRPIVTNLNHGQINMIVLVLIGLTWLALKEKRSAFAIGAPLAIAILLKTYPAVFLALLFFKKEYRAIAWSLTLIALATVASFVVLPAATWPEWIKNVMPTGGYGEIPWGLFSPAAPQNQSINGFAFRLFMENEFTQTVYHSPALVKLTAYVLSLGTLAITLALSYRAIRIAPDNRELIDLQFAIGLLMMFLIGPLSWDHHVVFALPAVILILYRLILAGRVTLLTLFAAPAAFLLAWDVPFFFVSLSNNAALAVFSMSLKFYAIVTFWFLGAALLYRMSRPSAQVATAVLMPRLAGIKRFRSG